ncbi:unnamed protein product, partial [Ectocarpus fasciculatus]
RTVGVLHKDAARVQDGYCLLPFGKSIYLFDVDGRVVHEWTSTRNCFCCYLLPDGCLLRDGSESDFAADFRTGGAAGYLEVVTWEGELVWSYSHSPYLDTLTHHDLEPLPNGNVLIMTWERRTKEEAVAAGRRPALLPDGEVWDNVIVELQPDGHGSATEVWRWSLWDHTVQDFDETKANYVMKISEHPEAYDINHCVCGGIAGARNLLALTAGPNDPPPSHAGKASYRGEKDWLHSNSVSYDPVRDQVAISFNPGSEILIVDHSTTLEEARGSTGGRSGRGGQILYRWGNAAAYQRAGRAEQTLFNQHSVNFLRGVPGEGNILVFNNGREPDRHWSSIDEIQLPEDSPSSGSYPVPDRGGFGPKKACWSFGPVRNHQNSFYCTHISGVQRLENGNSLITMGPQGIVVEVTSSGDEVWRYVSGCVTIVRCYLVSVSFVRQGEHRPECDRKSLFRVQRYSPSHPALAGRELAPGRYLEA